MQLMTKFGKFKLRFAATIHLAALISIFNVASTASSYWIKYRDTETSQTHYAGIWRSCPNQGGCEWRNGIVSDDHSTWSIMVRTLITIGTAANIILVGIYVAAFCFKLNKKSRYVIRFMECGNLTLLFSFIFIMIGFCIFISNKCNFSLWLHVLAILLIFCSGNMLTRTFASIYFQNTRFKGSKCVETAISHAKLASEREDERVALTNECNEEVVNVNSIEMNKISEKNASNEALIPGAGEHLETVSPASEAHVEATKEDFVLE